MVTFKSNPQREEPMVRVKFIALALVALALVLSGCDREITGDVKLADDSSQDCMQCHTDHDLFLVAAQQEWAQSIHASGNNTNRNRLNSSFYQACEDCHTAEGFLAREAGITNNGDHFTAIGCFTCHAPHTNGTLALRVEEAQTLLDGAVFNRGPANLCAACHHTRTDVTTFVVDGVELSTHWGPHHSGQSDMLIGSNGYEYAGYSYNNSPHTNAVVEGCISCHMAPGVNSTVGGHSWNMANAAAGIDNLNGCNASGCHDPKLTTFDRTAAADYDMDGTVNGVQTEIEGLLDSLNVALTDAGLLEDGEPTNGLTVSTADSAGAVFNYLFVHEDRSEGIHNTRYAVGLLTSAYNFIVHGNPNGAATKPVAGSLVSAH